MRHKNIAKIIPYSWENLRDAELPSEPETKTKTVDIEKENMRKFLEKDKRCGICNINYCKCDKPNFVKNEYNKRICNSCKKYKCMCVRITDFFKK